MEKQQERGARHRPVARDRAASTTHCSLRSTTTARWRLRTNTTPVEIFSTRLGWSRTMVEVIRKISITVEEKKLGVIRRIRTILTFLTFLTRCLHSLRWMQSCLP